MSMALGTEAVYQQLTILLVLATLSHLTIKRFHQPTIVGEIALGILIGPSVLGFYFNVYPFDQSLVASFAGLGAIFLLFLIGLESDFRAIYTTKNVLVAAGGVALPFVFGFVTAYLLVPPNAVGTSGTQFTMAIFMGATLTATSTAIAASVLLDLGLMKEPVAQTIMGAAVVDDILSLVVLSLVVGASRGEVNPLSIGLLVLAALAFIAEIVGLSAVVGAFLAGTLFASTPLREDFTEGAGYLGAIFTPIFFISLGLQVDLPLALGNVALLVFGAVLTVVAILTKVVGCGIPARFTKMTRHEALAVGWGMTPRGEVGLIVALAALSASVIAESLFSVLVVVMILVSVLPAPLFKRALAVVDDERRRAKAEAAADPR